MVMRVKLPSLSLFKTMLVRLILALIAVVTLSVQAGAQIYTGSGCDCREVEAATGQKLAGCIRVRARSGPAERGGELEWSLDGYPEAGEVMIGDRELRERVLGQIAALREKRPVCGFGAGCRFDGVLVAENDDVELNIVLPPELEQRPARAGMSYEGRLCLVYTPRKVVTTRFNLQLQIRTASGARVGERLCLQEGEDGPAISLGFTAQDLQNAGTDGAIDGQEAARQRVIDELRGVAGEALRFAREEGLFDEAGSVAINCPDDPQTKQVARRIEERLRKHYDLNARDSRVSWGRLDAGLRLCNGEAGCAGLTEGGGASQICDGQCGVNGGPTWIIFVSGLQLVRDVSVRVAPDHLDRQYTRTATGESLARLREKAERELNERFRSRFAARPGRIVTSDEVERDEALLCYGEGMARDRTGPCQIVGSLAGLSSDPDNPDDMDRTGYVAAPSLRYEVLRKLPPDRAIALKAGGSFSVEERLMGSFGLSGQGLLNLGEDASLDFSAGAQVRKLRVGLNRQFTVRDGSGWRLKSIGVDWSYLSDRDRRYGNLMPQAIAVRESDSTARLTFGYDSPEQSGGPARMRLSFGSDLLLEHRNLAIDERTALLSLTGLDGASLTAERSQVANLAINLRGGLTRDFEPAPHRRVSHYALSFETRLQRGMRLWGADYGYGRIWLTGQGEVIFGLSTPKDLLLRHIEGAGWSSAATPVFELFRLGGPSVLRGIEDGESIGRRLKMSQTEFGVGLAALRRAFGWRGTGRNDGLDLSNVYLKGFIDRARVTGLATGQRAVGYGTALELRDLPAGSAGRRLNLSIGYGFSPQSRLHRSGTLITSVGLSF